MPLFSLVFVKIIHRNFVVMPHNDVAIVSGDRHRILPFSQDYLARVNAKVKDPLSRREEYAN